MLLLKLRFSTKLHLHCLHLTRLCGLCHHPPLSNSSNVSGHQLAGSNKTGCWSVILRQFCRKLFISPILPSLPFVFILSLVVSFELDLKLNHAFESISRLLQAQEHPCQCFQALTTLFPSISRYTRSHTLADKQDGNSNNDPTLSLCQTTHSPGSFRSHNDSSYKDLRTFTASLLVLVYCLHPGVLTMVITRPTLTNPFWPAYTLSMFTLQPRIQSSPSQY